MKLNIVTTVFEILLIIWTSNFTSAEEDSASEQFTIPISTVVQASILPATLHADSEEDIFNDKPHISVSTTDETTTTSTSNHSDTEDQISEKDPNISVSTTDETTSTSTSIHSDTEDHVSEKDPNISVSTTDETTSTFATIYSDTEEHVSEKDPNVSVSTTDETTTTSTSNHSDTEDHISEKDPNISVSTTDEATSTSTSVHSDTEDHISENDPNISVSTTDETTSTSISIHSDTEDHISEKDPNISVSTTDKTTSTSTSIHSDTEDHISEKDPNISVSTTDESTSIFISIGSDIDDRESEDGPKISVSTTDETTSISTSIDKHTQDHTDTSVAQSSADVSTETNPEETTLTNKHTSDELSTLLASTPRWNDENTSEQEEHISATTGQTTLSVNTELNNKEIISTEELTKSEVTTLAEDTISVSITDKPTTTAEINKSASSTTEQNTETYSEETTLTEETTFITDKANTAPTSTAETSTENTLVVTTTEKSTETTTTTAETTENTLEQEVTESVSTTAEQNTETKNEETTLTEFTTVSANNEKSSTATTISDRAVEDTTSFDNQTERSTISFEVSQSTTKQSTTTTKKHKGKRIKKPKGRMEIFAKAINMFGDSVYYRLAQLTDNVAFSPFSLHTILSILALGAKGDTRSELLSKLKIKSAYNLKEGYTLYKPERRKIRFVNSIFYNKETSLQRGFSVMIRSIFKTQPVPVDFDKPRKTEKYINSWVANNTNQEILNFLEKNSLDGKTLAVLVNALYFEGKWKLKFDKSQTLKNATFRTPKGNVTCDMMTMSNNVQQVYSGPNFRSLVLPFSNTDLKIAFILPPIEQTESGNLDLTTTEKHLSEKAFFESLKNLKSQPKVIKVPKFKLSATYTLREVLMSLGYWRLFVKPDFSNAFTTQLQFPVSKVVQKTVIKIDENGATVAIASGAELMGRSKYPELTFDVPFLFVMYDEKNQIILIRGRVNDPNL